MVDAAEDAPGDGLGRGGLPERGGVVLIDGGCGFCDRTRRWILKRAPPGRFVFHALGSGRGRAWLAVVGHAGEPPESVVFIERERWSMASTAVLRIMRGVGGAWRLLHLLIVVPRPVRDWGYGVVSRHRHRL